MPFVRWADVEERTVFGGFVGRFVHSETMTFVYWDIAAGSALPEHAHPHEQVAHVLEGEFELSIDGQMCVLAPGEIGIIPSGARHSGRALTRCRIVDAFHPVREDYR